MQTTTRTHALVLAGLTLLFLAAIAATAALGNEGEHVDIVLATAIDESTGAPRNSVEFVPSGTSTLYAAMPLEAGRAGERIRFLWSTGSEEVASTYDLRGDVKHGWVFSALDTPGGMRPGRYRIEVFRGRTRVAGREFEVAE